MRLSGRVERLEPSPTLAITARAKALRAAGEEVFSLAAGEPDFATPDHICKAACAAMEAGHTGYAPSAGIPELRAAIRRAAARELGVDYGDDQVVVSCGAKQCLYNACMSLLEPGCEALIQAPYWVSYPEQVRLCGAQPVILPPPTKSFGLNLDAMAAAVGERTRLIVLNSPCNPTGHVDTGDDLDRVAELAIEHDLAVISDDIYRRIAYDGCSPLDIVESNPEMKDRTVVVNGVSKAYSMTGWRLGWALGPPDLIAAMRKIQDQSTSNAVTFVQHAAVAALESPPGVVEKMVEAFAARRERVVELLGKIEGVSCEKPEGAFYVLPSFKALLGRKLNGVVIDSGLRLAEVLLEEERVAVVPGEAFAAPGHIRISFAASIEVIEEAISRIAALVGRME
ncbi:MAG TPA: pyridoxal phosphate-dependent aminotransferase [Myxococcota bacterium]|nr:pyridoxal phosphate-dependent aminotransferase [Myxococcota bacterium]